MGFGFEKQNFLGGVKGERYGEEDERLRERRLDIAISARFSLVWFNKQRFRCSKSEAKDEV